MGKQSKNGKSETSGVGAVIAAICIIIYLGALVQAAVRLYLSVEQCRIQAEEEFDEIAALAQVYGRRGFTDPQFIETMYNKLRSSTSIEALIIYGPEGEYPPPFERQSGYAVNMENNPPSFINKWGLSNKGSKPLQIDNIRGANIKAVARAFDYNELSKILKETLLIIMVGFALSFFTMLLQFLAGTGAGTGLVRANEKTEPADTDSDTDTGIKDTESGPKGLYSSRSNIGWEEYTRDRLDSELHRCSATEKDLSLLYMDFTDIKNDAMYRQAAEEAAAFFMSRDLLFEYGKYGVCAILPGDNLETGKSKAEKFYRRILEKFPGGKNTSGLRAGISSRSGRLLNADTLMMEAAEGLNKARKDKSPIIAFKSNLDKYRAFIASQNRKVP